jgi:hypothetical protein
MDCGTGAESGYPPPERQEIMPTTKNFECKACGATFDTKEQLDGHNRREHSSGATAGAGASTGKGTGGTNPTQKKNM